MVEYVNLSVEVIDSWKEGEGGMLAMTDLRLYTVQEVAEILKVTPWTVRQYVSSGKLCGYKVGRSIRISEDGLRRFLEGLQ